MVESKQHASQNESPFNLFCFEIAYHHVTQTGFKITIFQPMLSQYMDYRCVLLCFICFFPYMCIPLFSMEDTLLDTLIKTEGY